MAMAMTMTTNTMDALNRVRDRIYELWHREKNSTRSLVENERIQEQSCFYLTGLAKALDLVDAEIERERGRAKDAEKEGEGACHDCGAAEGEMHQLGCDMERCPICGAQAITCYEHCVYPKSGKLRPSFEEGKRFPYVLTPNYCIRCLEPYPDMFHVTDEEWQTSVPPDLRAHMLCRNCYDLIKNWTAMANAEKKEGSAE